MLTYNKKIACLPWLLLLGITGLGIILSGCATTGDGGSVAVGPQTSSSYDQPPAVKTDSHAVKIDVVVPVFDPNIPEDSDTWEKQGIYPELRRAESNRFALKMKAALEDKNAFGVVRVVPNATVTGDLYVNGKILQSNGEEVKINITVADISGKQWFTKDFKHRAKASFHQNIRNKGKDAYDPVFEKVAAYIVAKLKKRKSAELARLQRIAEIRFGNSLSADTFARYLKETNGRVDLVAAPADDDPMLLRIKPIRVRNQLFIDEMQTHYADFNQKLDNSYLVWQQQSLVEITAARKATRKATAQAILGGLLAVAGVVAIAGADTYNPATDLVGSTAIVAGAAILGQSFQTRGEMKVHREALAELGQSIDIEIAPQVVEYENQTAKLVGDASEQHKQWIAFLKKIYALEATPNKKL